MTETRSSSSPLSSTAKKRRKRAGGTTGGDVAIVPQFLREEPSSVLFPSKGELLKLVAVIAIAASVAATCNFLVGSINRHPRPFCDTGSTGDDYPDVCEPCPEHGECSGGQLESCALGYKKIGRRCVEDDSITRTTNQFSNWVERQVCEAAVQFSCQGTGSVWFQEADLLKLLEEFESKENVRQDDESFMLIKQKALRATESALEMRTGNDGIKEFKCPDWLIELHKPFPCSLQQWVHKHVLLLLCFSAMLAGLVMVFWKVRQAKYLSTRAEQLYEQICEILEEHAMTVKSLSNKDEPWVIYSWLRDHLLRPSERKDRMLWKKVEGLVQEDSRIDQYPKLIKGESRIVLEWQVEGSLSSKMKKRKESARRMAFNDHMDDQTDKHSSHLGQTLLVGELTN